MKRRFFLTIITLFSLLTTVVAQVKFSANVPRMVAAGEPFRVEFSANDKIEDFIAPSFDGFQVIAGPSTSQSTSVEYINGKMSKAVNFTYTYVLIAENGGNFKVGSAKCTIDDKNYATNSYDIEVVQENDTSDSAAAGQPSQSSSSAGSLARQSATSSKTNLAKDDFILRTELSTRSVYKGEPIRAAVKLYFRTDPSQIGNFVPATFNGFWKYDFESDLSQRNRVSLNNKVYDVVTIREFLLFPQKSGKLEIESMKLTAAIPVMIDNGVSNSVFDNFFGSSSSYTTVEKNLVSAPVVVDVKSLPTPAPASFGGAVGTFNISSSISADSISANGATAITLSLKGEGNMPLITAPKLSLPGSFELYPAKTSDKFTESRTNVRGERIFEFPFIARSEGEFKINGVEFTYFDPHSKSYKTIATEPITLTVTADSSSLSSPGSIINPITKEELKIIGQDIEFIKVNNSKFSLKDSFLMGSILYIAMLFIIVLLFVALLFYAKKRIKELRDTVKVKNKKANKVATSRLKNCHKFMAASNRDSFYTEMLTALLGYVADKLNIEVSKLSKENISDSLASKGVENDDITLLLSTISACEEAKFAPSAAGDMNEVYNASLQLIGRLEAKL